jgi:Uma2 family endonuclease
MTIMLPHPASSISSPIRPLRRIEYDKLVADGCFQGERVELVFGMVVVMAPTDPAHGESVLRLDEILKARLIGRARVSCQSPFAATEDSEPEPDIFVVPVGEYWRAHPDRAYLVVEVARTSLVHDRGAKALLYANSRVDEYWVVDLSGGVVEVYRDRRDGGWQTITTHARGEAIAPRAFPDAVVEVSQIVPPIG